MWTALVGGVGRGVVKADIFPEVDGLAQRRAPASRFLHNFRALAQDIVALVARLDQGFEGDAIGCRSRCDAHRMTDRAAAELKDRVLTQVVQQLMRLRCVNST